MCLSCKLTEEASWDTEMSRPGGTRMLLQYVLGYTYWVVGSESTKMLIAFSQTVERWCTKCKLWLLLNPLEWLFFLSEIFVCCFGVFCLLLFYSITFWSLWGFLWECYYVEFWPWLRKILSILLKTKGVSMWHAVGTFLIWAKDRGTPR